MELQPITNDLIPLFKKEIKEYKEIDWMATFIYKIMVNNILVGFIALDRYFDNSICITCIHILEDYRNRGYGYEAINQVISSNKKCDIYGFVNVKNERAIKFYQKHWYFLDNRRSGLTKQLDNAYYVKSLKSYEIRFNNNEI